MAVQYEAGRYQAVVTDQGFTESKAKKTPQFFMVVKILGKYDERDGELYECQVSDRTLYRAITNKTIDYLIEDLQSLGWRGTRLSSLDPNTEGFYDFRERNIDVYCKHEEYNNQTQERWQIHKERQAQPMEAQALRKLDAMFGQKLKQAASTAPAEPSKPMEIDPAETEPRDDDTPF